MNKNIGYHTRLYRDNAIKVVGGSFGGQIDAETVNRLTRLFSVRILPSGQAVFVDQADREVRLYITVDPADTEKGKAAKKAWQIEQNRLEAEEEAQRKAEAAEIEELISGLSHNEIIRRLKDKTT